MQAMLRVLAAVSLTAWAMTAWAQDEDKEPEKPEEVKEAKVGEQAPPIQAEEWANAEGKTVSLDTFKGRVVALFFFKSDDGPSVEAIPKLNQVYDDLGKGGLVIIGLTAEKKDKAETTIKGKNVKFIVGYGSKSAETYKLTAPPRIYLIDTAGKLVHHFHALEEPAERIREQMGRTPPAGFDATALQGKLAAARAKLEAKEYGRAYTLAKEVSKIVDKESTPGKVAAKLIEEIEEAAKKWLEEGKDAAKSKDWDKACKILAELSVRFAGTGIGADADNEISKQMAERDFKSKIRVALDNAKGWVLNDQAADHEASKRYLEAMALYREVTEKYPDTEAAKAADAAQEKIKSDPTAQEAIKNMRAEEEADRWLDIADRFAKVQMNDKAREFYQRIIDTHPTARAATKAKERIAKLPEEKPAAESEDATAASQPAKDAGQEKDATGGTEKGTGGKERTGGKDTSGKDKESGGKEAAKGGQKK